MCDYPFFIPQVVLFANSSLFWFKVTNEHREFRNYLLNTIKNGCPFVGTRFVFPFMPVLKSPVILQNPVNPSHPWIR